MQEAALTVVDKVYLCQRVDRKVPTITRVPGEQVSEDTIKRVEGAEQDKYERSLGHVATAAPILE